MTQRRSPAGRSGGFVLVLTLWVLVVVAIAASYFSEKVAAAVALAQQSRQNAQTSIDMASTRAEMLYRLTTTSVTVDGLGHGNTLLRLDNQPYRALGNTVVQLQDTRGLFNLNQTPDDRIARFLGLMGVPPEQHAHLIDTLRDYTDPDHLERLNGAEDASYRARGLPPPTHNSLTTPLQVRRIIGWRDQAALWQSSTFIDLCTTSTALGLNPNTAPFEVLATLPGITNESARALVQNRRSQPILHQGQLSQLTGIPEVLLDMQIIVIPADTLRITQTSPTTRWAEQYTVTLTPNASTGPWRLDYFSRISHSPLPASPVPEPLPPRSSAPPDVSPLMRLDG